MSVRIYDAQLGFAEANDRAIDTLAFVAPHVVLPCVMEQLRADINGKKSIALTDEDLGNWETSEGAMYVGGEISIVAPLLFFV